MTQPAFFRLRARAFASLPFARLAVGVMLAAFPAAAVRAAAEPTAAASPAGRPAKPKPKKAAPKAPKAPAPAAGTPAPSPAPKKKPAKRRGKRVVPAAAPVTPPPDEVPVPPAPPPEPPPAPAPEPAPPEDDAPPPVAAREPPPIDDAPPPAPVTAAASEPWVTLAAGGEGGLRSFRQTEPTTGEVRTSNARGVGGYAVDLELRSPMVASQAWLSVEGHYWRAVAFSVWSRRAGPPGGLGAAVGGTSYRLDGRLHAKVRTAKASTAPVVGVFGGVSKWAMDFDIAAAPDLESPTGDYALARAGGEVKVPVRRFAFVAEASFLYAFNAVAFGNRTAARAPVGLEGLLGVSFAVVPHLGLKVYGDYALLSTRLTPLPGSGDAPARVTDGSFMAGAALVGAF